MAYSSIAVNGVRGTSNRVVAAMSNVPLGSMTYHFKNVDELLYEAFSRYVDEVEELVGARLPPSLSREQAIDAVVQLIHEDFGVEGGLDYRVNYELYAMTSRDARYQKLLVDMTEAGRAALAHHFGDATARALNTYIEGATTHRALQATAHTVEETRCVVRLLVAGVGGAQDVPRAGPR